MFSDHLPEWTAIKKYLRKGEFLLKGIQLGNFTFDEGLFQLKGVKGCLFVTSVWQDTKEWMLSTVLGIPEDINHRSVLG